MPRFRKTYRRRTPKTYARKGVRGIPRRRPQLRGRKRFARKSFRRRKALLNVTSRKKRDEMQCISDVTVADRDSGEYETQPARLTVTSPDQVPYQFLWCATARTTDVNPPAQGTVVDQATRTAKSAFIRGLAERVEINTNDGTPWQWRRIVFRMKGIRFFQVGQDEATPRELYFRNGTDGYGRLVTDWGESTASSTINAFVFKGTRDDDWSSINEAHVDTTRVSLMYDKTVHIRAGNESGVSRIYRRWHPVNKNLIYNDDEAGASEESSHFSVESMAGCGDVYVMDIFTCSEFAETTARLNFKPQAALYWHER